MLERVDRTAKQQEESHLTVTDFLPAQAVCHSRKRVLREWCNKQKK